PELPLVIDRYEGWVHVADFERHRDEDEGEGTERQEVLLSAVADTLQVARGDVFFKTRSRQRGTAQYERLGSRKAREVVSEGGYRFHVNFTDYLDTGLFLDHRQTRAMVEAEVRGKRFLNLFGYTGAFTVYAAGGGARETTTVDLSNTYLDWAAENLRLNGFGPEGNRLIRMDVLKWLGQAHHRGERFDLILLDPPTWSTSKSMEENMDLQRDHVRLIQQTLALLDPGGVLYFSTNNRRFQLDPAAFDGAHWEEISRTTRPEDFRDSKIHRCWRSELAGSPSLT
ncbi:MAG: class I SAM-dependent methyltransferase, partial [Myxococcota bacterium]|nr:class I SAM-dependent methyltransferase [Myxococcota bacterium]